MVIIILLLAVYITVCLFFFVLGKKAQASDDKVIIDNLTASNKKLTSQANNFRDALASCEDKYGSSLIETYQWKSIYYSLRMKFLKDPVIDQDQQNEILYELFEILGDLHSEAQASGLTVKEYILSFKD